MLILKRFFGWVGTIFLGQSLIAAAFALAQPKALENGWYEKDLPIPVLHLEGSIETIARAHGKLAASQPHGKDAIHFYGNRLNEYLENSYVLKGHPWWQALTKLVYRIFFRNSLLQNTPERYVNAYQELAKAMDEPVGTIWDALVLPDVALRLASLSFKGEIAPLFLPSFGCSSVIWNTGSASVLHGRNLDYEGAGVWDANPVMLHLIPDEGLAHVAITSLGIHTPGFTAFNEAGLTLSIHQLTLTGTTTAGTPMPVITAEIIRNARTIDDAVTILKNFPRTAGWAYILSQGRDRAVIETSEHELSIRRSSEPVFFQTNHVSSPALQRTQVYYSAGSWLDSQERMQRLIAMAPKKQIGSPKALVEILRDRPRVVSGTIDKLDNIQSVIFDATRRTVWVHRDGRYYEYHWSDLRSADPPKVYSKTIAVPQNHTALAEKMRIDLKWAHEAPLKEVQKKFSLLDENISSIQNAFQKKQLEPGYWGYLYVHAMLLLKDSTTLVAESEKKTRFEQEISLLTMALEDPDLAKNTAASNHRKALGAYLVGAYSDLAERRPQALLSYFQCQKNTPFERLKKSCSFHMLKRFHITSGARFQVDWAGADLMKYP